MKPWLRAILVFGSLALALWASYMDQHHWHSRFWSYSFNNDPFTNCSVSITPLTGDGEIERYHCDQGEFILDTRNMKRAK